MLLLCPFQEMSEVLAGAKGMLGLCALRLLLEAFVGVLPGGC